MIDNYSTPNEAIQLSLLAEIFALVENKLPFETFVQAVLDRAEIALDCGLVLWTPQTFVTGKRIAGTTEAPALFSIVRQSVDELSERKGASDIGTTSLDEFMTTTVSATETRCLPFDGWSGEQGFLFSVCFSAGGSTDRRILRMLVNLITQAGEQARVAESLTLHQTVVESVALLAEHGQVTERIHAVLQRVSALLGAQHVLVYRLDRSATSFHRIAAVGAQVETASPSLSIVDVPELRTALRRNTPQFYPTVRGSLRTIATLTRAGIRSELIVPLHTADSAIGLLIARFTGKESRPVDAVLKSVQSIGQHIAFTLERHRTLDDHELQPTSLTALLDFAPIGIAIWHVTGTLSLCNAIANQMFGQRLHVGMTLPEFMAVCDIQMTHPDGSPLTLAENPVLQALRQSTPDPILLTIRTDAGMRAIMTVSGRTQDGKSIIVISYDVTTLHDALRQVWKSQAEIDILKEANAQKTAFMEMVAHDIRNPLSIIIGLADILALDKRNSQVVADNSVEIVAQCLRIRDLVEEYLELVRLEAGADQFRYAAVLLPELLQDATKIIDTRTRPLSLTLPDELPPVWTDRAKILRVLENLLSNAVKYSEAHTPIEIIVQQNATQIVIHVCDHGMGIPLETQPYIFTKFYRGTVDKAIPGTGLGLAISREIVMKLGGDIGFESTPGSGSRFWLQLPAYSASSTTP